MEDFQINQGGGMVFEQQLQDQLEIDWAEKLIEENISFDSIEQNIDSEILQIIEQNQNNLIFNPRLPNGDFLQNEMKGIINFVNIPTHQGIYPFPDFYAGLFQQDYSYSSVLLAFEFYDHYLSQNFFGEVLNIKLSDDFQREFNAAGLFLAQVIADLRGDLINETMEISRDAQQKFANFDQAQYQNVKKYSTHQIKVKIKELGFNPDLQSDLNNILISNEQGVQMQEIQGQVEQKFQQTLQISLSQKEQQIIEMESKLNSMGQQIQQSQYALIRQDELNQEAQRQLNQQIQLKTFEFDQLKEQYQSEKQNYDVQTKNLQNQLQQLEGRLKQNVDQLSQNLSKEQQGFSLERTKFQLLQRQLESEIESLNQIATQNQTERAQLFEQNKQVQESLRTQLGQLNQSLSQKQETIEQIKKQLAAEQLNVKNKVNEIEKINLQVKLIQGELETQTIMNNQQKQIQDELKSRIKALEDERFQLEQKDVESQSLLTKNQNEMARKDVQIQKLQSEIESQVQIYKQIEAARTELENKIRVNSQELMEMAAVKQKIDQVTKEKQELELYIKEQSEKIVDNSTLRENSEVQQQKIIRLQEEVFQKDQRLQMLGTEMSMAQQKFKISISYKDEELNKMAIQIQDVNQQQEIKQDLITSLEKQKSSLIKQNETLLQQIQEVNRELNSSKEQFRIELKNKQSEILKLQQQLDLSKNTIPETQVKMNTQLMEIIQTSIKKINNLEPEQIKPVEQQDNEIQQIFLKYKQETEIARQKLQQQKQKTEDENFILKQQIAESVSSKTQMEKRLELTLEQYNSLFERIKYLEQVEIDQRLRFNDMKQLNQLLEQKDRERKPLIQPEQPQLQQIIIQQVQLPDNQPEEVVQSQIQPPQQAQIEYENLFVRIQEMVDEIVSLKKLIPNMEKKINEYESRIKNLQSTNLFLTNQFEELDIMYNNFLELVQKTQTILRTGTDPFEIVQQMFALFQINRQAKLKNPKKEFDELLEKYNNLHDQFEYLKRQHAQMQVQLQAQQQHSQRKLEVQPVLPQVGRAAELIDQVLVEYQKQQTPQITEYGLSSIFNQIMTTMKIPSEIDLGLNQNELKLLRSATADQLMVLFSLWDYDFFRKLFESEFINQSKIRYMDFLISLSSKFQEKIEMIINRKKQLVASTKLQTSDTQTEEAIFQKLQPTGMVIEKDKKLERERLFFQSGFGGGPSIVPVVDPSKIIPEIGSKIISQTQPLVIPKKKAQPKLDIVIGPVFEQDPARIKNKSLGFSDTTFTAEIKATEPIPKMERKIFRLYTFAFEMKPIPKQKPSLKAKPIYSVIALPPQKPVLKEIAVQTAYSNFLGLKEEMEEEVMPIVVPKPFAAVQSQIGIQTDPQPEPLVEEKQGAEIQTQTDFYDPEPMDQEQGQPLVQDKFYNPRENRQPEPQQNEGQQRPEPIDQEFDIDEAIDVDPNLTKEGGRQLIRNIIQNQVERIAYAKPKYTRDPIDEEDDEEDEDEDFFRPSTYTDQSYSQDSLYDLYYLLLRVRQILNKQVAAGDRRKDDKRLQSVNVSIKIVKSNIDYQKMTSQNKAQYF